MGRQALVIDDEPVLAKNIQKYFALIGYATRVADSAEAGLGMINDSRPDVVLLDYQLPGVDGMSLLAYLRNADPDLKVIMLTGNGNLEIAVEAMRLGATDFLTKPISLHKLRGVVNRAVGPESVQSAEDGQGHPAPAVASSRLMTRIKDDWRRLLER